jgi:hypothetical protein
VRKQCTEFTGRGESGIALRNNNVPEPDIDKVMEEVVDTDVVV